MRPIDADELKDLIHSKSNGPEDLWDTMGVLNAINNIPTIPLPDFKEGYKQAIIDGQTNFQRQEGEWIEGIQGYYCSECETIDRFYFEHNFCPNCGASMVGGDE